MGGPKGLPAHLLRLRRKLLVQQKYLCHPLTPVKKTDAQWATEDIFDLLCQLLEAVVSPHQMHCYGPQKNVYRYLS